MCSNNISSMSKKSCLPVSGISSCLKANCYLIFGINSPKKNIAFCSSHTINSTKKIPPQIPIATVDGQIFSNPGQFDPPRPPNFKVVFFVQVLRRVDERNQTPQHDMSRTPCLTSTFPQGLNNLSHLRYHCLGHKFQSTLMAPC